MRIFEKILFDDFSYFWGCFFITRISCTLNRLNLYVKSDEMEKKKGNKWETYHIYKIIKWHCSRILFHLHGSLIQQFTFIHRHLCFHFWRFEGIQKIIYKYFTKTFWINGIKKNSKFLQKRFLKQFFSLFLSLIWNLRLSLILFVIQIHQCLNSNLLHLYHKFVHLIAESKEGKKN